MERKSMGSMFTFVIHNFSHVAPILLCGAFGIMICLERTMALFYAYTMNNYEGFFERLRHLVMKDAIQDAIALCDRYRGIPAARVAREGLMRAHQPESLIEKGLQIAVGEAVQKIQARTAFLGTIANVATLFGLFGTIIGLVQSFEAVGSASAQQRSALLANGISTAMNATMLGLGIAIPCMIAFSILMARTAKVVGQVDQAAVRTMDLLQQRYFATEAMGPQDANSFAQVRRHR
jgi:biopolymer transport protein ExbB